MNDTVTLAHGAGGKQTNELIDRVFKAHFANPDFTGDDAAVLPVDAGKIAFTTDGFIVSPTVFPAAISANSAFAARSMTLPAWARNRFT